MSLGITSGSDSKLHSRHRISELFATFCRFCTWTALLVLLVLLVSIAGQTTHDGYIYVFVDSIDAGSEVLNAVEDVIGKNARVKSVEREVDPSGEILFNVLTHPIPFVEGKPEVRYADISRGLRKDAYDLDVELTFDSSEPVRVWDPGFLARYPSKNEPETAGVLHALWGSLWLLLYTALIAVPIGIGAAVYLEEYATDTWLTRLIKLSLANLAGVPSIVYGILGLCVFVEFFDVRLMIGSFKLLPLGASVLAGAITLALLVLPVIIVATQEALKSIPDSIRKASFALGATKWQTIRHQILPASLPGIATGVILALSRALGETAPIVVIGVVSMTNSSPGGIETPSDALSSKIFDVPMDSFAALPVQIYGWASEAQPEFAAQGAKAILVLLAVLVCMNSVAIFIRHKFQKNLNW